MLMPFKLICIINYDYLLTKKKNMLDHHELEKDKN